MATYRPTTAQEALNRLVAAKQDSDATLKPIWINAKRQQLALREIVATGQAKVTNEAKIKEWQAVIDRIERNVTQGTINEFKEALASAGKQGLRRTAAISGTDAVPSELGGVAKRGRGRPPSGAAQRQSASALALLVRTFGSTTEFGNLAAQTRALYTLVWVLTPEERLSFATELGKARGYGGSTPTDLDRRQLSSFFLELFRQTFEVTQRPGELVFVGRYLHPSVMSPPGQYVLFSLINYLFNPSARHAGGVSDSLRLSGPDWDRIGTFNAALVSAYRTQPQGSEMVVDPSSAAAAAAGGGGSGDDDDDEELAFDDESAAKEHIQRLLPVPFEPLRDAVEASDLTDVTIPANFVSAAIYSRRLMNYIELWMISEQRRSPETINERAEVEEEQRNLIALREARETYYTSKNALLQAVREQRKPGGRLLMTDERYASLEANIGTIEARFVGVFGGKSDLMQYLQRQLVGPRPRPVTANHIVATGEPGTGKTSLMQIVAEMMIGLGLIDSPTLESYELVGRTLERSTTSEEYNRLSEARLPDDVPADELEQVVGKPTVFSLRAATANGGNEAVARPQVYDPGKFESPFEGGQLSAFLLAVFRGLGSTTIIDEAYGLREDRFRPVVDQLVALITQLGTQWSTALLGYEASMRAFFADGNEGLEGRYNTTVRFSHYSAIELVAILAREMVVADNVLYATSASSVTAVANEADSNAAGVRAALDDALTQLYNAMGPYAMRGTRRGSNLFGAANVRAVQKLFAVLGNNYAQPFNHDKTLLLITPQHVGDALRKYESTGQRFGEWATGGNYRARQAKEPAAQ